MSHLAKFVVALTCLVMPAPTRDRDRGPTRDHDRDRDRGAAAAAAPADTTGIELLKRASVLHANAKYPEAIATYDSAAAKLPLIADWIAVFAAASAAQTGDTAAVERRLKPVDATLSAEWGWRARVRANEKAGAVARAIEIAAKATATGTATKRAEAWYRIAELQRDSKNATAQRAALISAMEAAPESDQAADAAREFVNLPDLSSSERLLVGRTLMRNGEITRGVRELERAIESGGASAPESSPLHYEIGRALFSAAKYEDAARHLGAVSNGERASDARYMLGRANYRLGRVPEGRRILESVVTRFPTSSSATRALYLLGDLSHDDNNIPEATALFERAAAAPARIDESALAVMRLGDIAFVRQDYAKAAEIFNGFASRYPNGGFHDQAIYWLAMSNMKLGKEAAANERLKQLRRTSPLSYYGMRAAAIQGGSPLDSTMAAPPAANEPIRADLESGLERWQLLREVGWDRAAGFELNRFRRRFATDRPAMYAIAEELNERGAPHLGIAIGRELLASGAPWDRRMLEIMYPMPYQSLIEREARANGLDPYFVAALIRQESRFHARAVSGAGAVGLMQVMPATGKQLDKQAGGGKTAPPKLTEPDVNIKLGTKFLADLTQIYGDRVDAILIAYNAGPTRADRWRNFPEFGMEDLFIERIPFDETRNYVKAVKLNAAIYRALYQDARGAD